MKARLINLAVFVVVAAILGAGIFAPAFAGLKAVAGCPQASSSAIGCVEVDGTTITASNGVITAVSTGSGTVSSAASNSLAYYASNGTVVSGTTTIPNGIVASTFASAPALTMASGQAITPDATAGILGVTSNTAAAAGAYGELQYINCEGPNSTQTITVTIASPAVVSWASSVQWAVSANHPILWACPIVFTSSGALPTGITSGTVYWVGSATISGLNFDIFDTAAHAIACVASFGSCTGIVNTSGSQSGTQTGTMGSPLTGTSSTWAAGAAMYLQAGDWDCSSVFQVGITSFTTATGWATAVNTSIGAPTGNNVGNYASLKIASSTIATSQEYLLSPPTQELLASSTIVYGEGFELFGGGSAAAGALLRCRRMH